MWDFETKILKCAPINFFEIEFWFFCRKRYQNRSRIDGGVAILVRGSDYIRFWDNWCFTILSIKNDIVLSILVTTTKISEFALINFFRINIWFFCRKRHPNRSKIDGGVVILVRGIKKKGGWKPPLFAIRSPIKGVS